MPSPSWLLLVICLVALPLLAVGLFARWVGRQTQLSFDEKTKAWGVLTALLSSLTVIGGGALVVGKYADEQSRLRGAELQAAAREAAQRDRQLANQDAARLQTEHDRLQRLYDATMTAATRLRSLAPSDLPQLTRGATRSDYEDLYWARLIGLESPDVEAAMVAFRQLLVTWERTGTKPAAALDAAILRLASACHAHLTTYQSQIVVARRRELGLDDGAGSGAAEPARP